MEHSQTVKQTDWQNFIEVEVIKVKGLMFKLLCSVLDLVIVLWAVGCAYV